MTEALMVARFETYCDLFKDAKNSHKLSEGWSKVAYEVGKTTAQAVSGDKCRQQYGRMQQKWRDHKPTGKESVRTGNPSPGTNVKDDTFAIIQPFFSKKPGCGSSLGQATDDPDSSPDISDGDESSDSDNQLQPKPMKRLKTDLPKKPLTQAEGIAMLGQSFDGVGMNVAEGLKSIASSIGTRVSGNDDLKKFLEENREEQKKMRETLDRVASIQGAMLEFMQKVMNNQ